MSGFTHTQSRQMLLPKGDQAPFTGPLYPGGGAIGVNEGQLVIRTKDRDGHIPLTAIAPTAITAATGHIQFGVATDKVRASNVNPMSGTQRFDESAFFDVAKVKYKVGEASMGALAVTALFASFDPQDGEEYGLGFQIVSARNVREHTAAGDRIICGVRLPEDVTDYDNAKSFLMGRLVAEANLQSDAADTDGRREFVVFAINSQGNGGTAISAITAGTSIKPNSDSNGVNISPLMKRSLKLFTDENVDFANASIVEVVENHGVDAGDDVIDGVIVIGLDQQEAIHDELLGSRVDIHVSPVYGFADYTAQTTVGRTGSRQEVSKGDSWEKEFREGAFGKTGLTEVEGVTNAIVKRESGIDKSKYYDCYVFYGTSVEQTFTIGQRVEQMVQILLPVTLTIDASGDVQRTQDYPQVKAAMDNVITQLDAI